MSLVGTTESGNSGTSEFDVAHSGVCTSVTAYCGRKAAIPAFRPAAIDLACLEDPGLTIVEASDLPETYGIAGWMGHLAFALSVSREPDVLLADPQPRYDRFGGKWENLVAVDLPWADADAFGNRSTVSLSGSFPLTGTVRYSGGSIGTGVRYPGLPPVYGDASLSIGLDSMRGRAGFTSLRMSCDGVRYIFGDVSLYYSISVEENGIRDDAAGVSLVASFYGPEHEEVAGTLDDSQAGLLASFGGRHVSGPEYLDMFEEADHVRGMRFRDGFSENADGWRRYRCGAGPCC